MTAASTVLYSSVSLFSHFPYSFCSTFLSFLSQWFPLHHFPQRSLSTYLEAENLSTCRVRSGRRLPRLAAAIGFCLSIPFLCFAIFPSSRSWHVSRLQSSFPLSTISPAWERSTRMRWTRGAWSLSSKKPRLPMVPIIHHRIRRLHHHQHKGRVQESLPSPSPCSLLTFCVFCARSWPLISRCTTSVCVPLQVVSR